MYKRFITFFITALILTSCAKAGVAPPPADMSVTQQETPITGEDMPPDTITYKDITPSPDNDLPEPELMAATDTKAGGITADFTIANSWQSEGRYFYQFAVTVKNNTADKIGSWTVSYDFPAGVKLTDSWCGKYTLNGTKLTIKNESYNGELTKGGVTNDVGFIVSSPTEITAKKTPVTGGGNTDNGTALPAPPGAFEPAKTTNKKTKDWLHAKGNKLYDANGQEVWLTGINWFGYNTGTNTFDGLWNTNADELLQGIADKGFNLLRIPISAELLRDWSKGEYPRANYNQSTNSHFNDKNSLQIFDYIINKCGAVGLKIMIDIHSAKTDAAGHMKPVWYDGDITEEVYINALAWMAKRYKDDDTIIAYDLKNEPHGKPEESPRAIWNNSKDKDNWKYVAEKTALRVLKENPNVLIVIEGIEIYPKDIKANGSYASKNGGDYHYNWWGGNLRGVKDFPVDLGEYQNKVVYSPHDYGPTVYKQPWFYDGYNYNTLYKDVWKDNWMFIYEDKTAPLLIGEWGGYLSEPNLTWMTHLRKLISTYRLHHTFWCLNPNSGDTGGLLKDDFKTWDEEKYAFVKPVLWQKDGKFVGLNHEVALGKNGISLNRFIELTKK